jgi:hypothetical protein
LRVLADPQNQRAHLETAFAMAAPAHPHAALVTHANGCAPAAGIYKKTPILLYFL